MIGDESLVELTDIPQSDTGAPMPEVHATEDEVMIAFALSDAAGEVSGGSIGIVVFERVNTHLFGSPNDEALHGHRLAPLGLGAYSFYRVENSKWIAELCARNRVHRLHTDEMYANLKHFIFTFHDTTFEIAARSYRVSVASADPFRCLQGQLMNGSSFDLI